MKRTMNELMNLFGQPQGPQSFRSDPHLDRIAGADPDPGLSVNQKAGNDQLPYV
jgi:hypothetical protein